MESLPLYESPLLREVTGPTLRPGGFTLTARAVSFSGLERGAAVLDVGCGLGATAAWLEENHGLKALGLDVSPGMLKQGRRNNPQTALLAGRADRLPLKDSRFDARAVRMRFISFGTARSRSGGNGPGAQARRLAAPGRPLRPGVSFAAVSYTGRRLLPPGVPAPAANRVFGVRGRFPDSAVGGSHLSAQAPGRRVDFRIRLPEEILVVFHARPQPRKRVRPEPESSGILSFGRAKKGRSK